MDQANRKCCVDRLSWHDLPGKWNSIGKHKRVYQACDIASIDTIRPEASNSAVAREVKRRRLAFQVSSVK
jgi:hypothetical protein